MDNWMQTAEPTDAAGLPPCTQCHKGGEISSVPINHSPICRTRRILLRQSFMLVAIMGCVTGCANSNANRPVTRAPAGDTRTQNSVADQVVAAKEFTLELGGGVTLNLMLIPPGHFNMGGTDAQQDDFKQKQHEVTITQAFYMGATHVTVDQFAAFVKATGYKTDAEKAGWTGGLGLNNSDRAFFRANGASWHKAPAEEDDLAKGDHPVVSVSWNDAKAFCDWASLKTRKKVVLPTEAQWEYACRAGTTTVFPWGDNPDDGKGWANCADQSLKRKIVGSDTLIPFFWGGTRGDFFNWDDGFVLTSPVGTFKPNSFGLYDMLGNAWQWCQDLKELGTPPSGLGTENYRMTRGGSWNATQSKCNCATRFAYSPDFSDGETSFRVVME
jgi:sulfatase modifying factor 1